MTCVCHGRGAVVPTLREQSHRRALLLGIALLLVLSTSPLFAHHVAIGAQVLMGGIDHVGAFCRSALYALLAPVHYGFHVIFLVGLAYALWDRWRAHRSSARALQPLAASPPVFGEPIWRAATEAGVDPGRMRLVDGLPCPALTVGMLRPMIYLAANLATGLTAEELVSVIAHEGAHLRRRDPLRLSLLRFLACTLFWIPALRRLADDMADEAEILADDSATRGRPLVLATAILRLARQPGREGWSGSIGASVGFSRADLLERRVRRLAGERVAAGTHLTRRSFFGALAILTLVWASGLLMAQPLPAGGRTAAHCDHRYESAIRHLFCLGEPFGRRARECPHGAEAGPAHLHA